MSTSSPVPSSQEIQTLCQKYYITKTEKISPEQLFQIAKDCKYPDNIVLKQRIQELCLDNPSLCNQQWIPFSLAEHFITQLFLNVNMRQEILSKLELIAKNSQNKMLQFGFLTRKECSALLFSMAPSMTNEEVKGIVDELDDQGLGYCSIEELIDKAMMNRILV